MLNVSSSDDRSTPARIRDAAVEIVGRQGWEKTTRVIERLAEDKGLVLGAGPLPRIDTYLDDHPELRPITEYIGQCMRSGGAVAEHFF